VPDARTNSIVVRSENPERIARVEAIVKQLDVPTGAGGNIHVIYLKNAEATRVAQTLRSILSGEASVGPVAVSPPLAGGTGTAPGAPPPLLQASAVSTSGGGIVADPASNAVIITAPDAVVAHLKAVIEKLDVRRAQVFVEALIVELTADRAAEFGIQWQSLNGLTGTESQAFGGTNFGARGGGTNIIGVSAAPALVGSGLNIGVVRGQITLPGGIGTVANIGALARALATDTNANILSTPTLLTLDNEEAKIVIGQNLPFITGQYAQTGSATTVTPFQTIERKDVGLTLRIKPQISQGGAVRLQIFQEVSSVQEQTLNPAGPTTNKRAIESTVIVDDGQIVALGGLMQDSTTATVEKVPLLGDIPLIGSLFRYDTRKQTKTNLMVFLRPVVMRDSAAYQGVTTERYRQLLGEQEKSQLPPNLVLPAMPRPLLPPLEPAAPVAK
jgi:general secretion pathway protein D